MAEALIQQMAESSEAIRRARELPANQVSLGSIFEAATLADIFAPDPMMNMFISKMLFTNKTNMNNRDRSDILLTWAIIKALKLKIKIRRDHITDAATVDMYGANLPDIYCFIAEQDEADVYVVPVNFLDIMRWAFNAENVTDATWATYFNIVRGSNEITEISLPVNSRTVSDWFDVMTCLGKSLKQQYRRDPLQMVLTAIIGYVKRGQASDRHIERIVNTINEINRKNIHITKEAISCFYRTCRPYINELNAKNIMESIKEDIRGYPDAQYLTLTITEMSGSGLTGYLMIGQAIKLYPDFYWYRIHRVCQE